MNVLNRLTIKNLKLNKKRTIMTIIGITLAVALITAIASMYTSAVSSLVEYEKKRDGNFHVAFLQIPQEELFVFKNNREIEQINLTQSLGYAKIASKNESKPYAYVKAFTKESLENLSIRLTKGRLPENSDEIVVPTHLQTNGRLVLNVGDTITLDIGKRIGLDEVQLKQDNPFQDSGESIIDTTTKTYKIVGIIERPATNIESYVAPGYTFITYMDENNLSGDFDVYATYTKYGVKNAYKLTANILGVDEDLFVKANTKGNVTPEKYSKEMDKAKYDISINKYLIELETNPISNDRVVGLVSLVIIVIAIIIFTSVFCIKNSFDISITEKTKQYGMLKSVGATKKQIKENVFFEATILGLIGIPLGIILGFLASFILIIISNHYLEGTLAGGLKLQFSFSWMAVLVSAILGIVTIYFSAFRSARRASKIAPIDLIRNSANIKINPKKIKSPKIIKKIFGIGGEVSYKNLKRNKKKYRTTVISLIVSVSVFIALSGFMNIAFALVDSELSLSEYNVSLTASHIEVNNKEKYSKYIDTTKLDNIEDYTILRDMDFYFENRRFNPEYVEFLNLKLDDDTENNSKEYITIYTLGTEQYKKYVKELGLNYDEIKDKAILMDYEKVGHQEDEDSTMIYKTMRLYDHKKGETLSGTLKSGKDLQIEIGHITDVKPFGCKEIRGTFIVISDELYDEISKEKSSEDLKIVYKSNNANKLQNDIDEMLKGEEYNLNNKEERVRNTNNVFTLIGIFLYGFIIVISLIGITNIFNTITTNMELRKQEFAMLKSIGMTTKEFNRMIRLESLFMGVKALIFSVPIGIILSYIMYILVSEGSGIVYKFPIMAILISILAVFILIFLIMKYSINKIKKQNTIETIRNENI